MKSLLASLVLVTGFAGVAQAHEHGHHHHHRRHHTRAGSCQMVYADAQTAQASCRASGFGYERRWGSQTDYVCTCGFNPALPGSN